MKKTVIFSLNHLFTYANDDEIQVRGINETPFFGRKLILKKAKKQNNARLD